jgi:hypothetical protein
LKLSRRRCGARGWLQKLGNEKRNRQLSKANSNRRSLAIGIRVAEIVLSQPEENQ